MALIGWEGFDSWDGATQADQEGYSSAGGYSHVAGRFGGQAARCQDSDSITLLNAWPTPVSTFAVGFATQQTHTTATEYLFATFGSNPELSLTRIGSTGQLLLRTGGLAGTLLFTSANDVIRTNIWHYIVIAATIHASTGTYQIWVDGVDITSGQQTGQDTLAVNSTISEFGFIAANGVSTHLEDDVWWSDDLTFREEMRIGAFNPNGNGYSSQFDGSDGNSTDNYLLTDDVEPDGDTTYVQSLTAGEIDSYTFSDMADASLVVGVAVRGVMRKNDAGARSGRTILRTNSTNFESTTLTLTASYLTKRTYYVENPDTTADWTQSEVNALEAGVKVQA